MKTAKEYLKEYREIASSLGLRGDSVELLSQLLAHFTYTNEVENLAYTLEGSLERALQPNSKIQLCVEQMYSVFRGRCPRVILRFRPTKFFDLDLFERVATGPAYSLYYLGYVGSEGIDSPGALYSDNTGSMNFIYSPVTIPPTETGYVTIICLMASEIIERDFTVSEKNTYYLDIPESGLSSDLWIKTGHIGVGQEGMEYLSVTREFQKHLLDSLVFDLTLPDWGTRLYLPESYRVPGITAKVGVFKFLELDSLNRYDLGSIKVQGTEPVGFGGDIHGLTEVSTGVIILPETPREDLSTVHYRSNQDRYMGSILRSNSDVGDLLKEMYPLKVKGTSFKFLGTPEIITTSKKTTMFEGKVLQNNIESYSIPGSDSGAPHLEFSINPSETTRIRVRIDKTNSKDPGTCVYNIKTESPVSQLGTSINTYVLKTYLDQDSEVATEVITDLESEGLVMTYRYSVADEWSSVDPSGTIPARPLRSDAEDVSTSTSSTSTETSSGTTTTTTTTTDPEGNQSIVITEVVSTGAQENSSSGTGTTNTQAIKSTQGIPLSTEPLRIRLFSKVTNQEEDLEIVPYVTPDTNYFGIVDRNYTVPLTRTLESLIQWPQKIPTAMFVGGKSVIADSYEVLSHSKELSVSIDQSGVLSIDGLKPKSIGTYTAVVAAMVGNLQYTSTLTVTTTATEESIPRVLQLYRKLGESEYLLVNTYDVLDSSVIDITDIKGITGATNPTDTNEVILAIDCDKSGTKAPEPNDIIAPINATEAVLKKLKNLSINSGIVSGGTSIYTVLPPDLTDTTTFKQITLQGLDIVSEIESTDSVQSRSEFVPELKIYYIPQLNSDLLSDSEKKTFIDTRRSYYITNNISVDRGNLFNVTLELNVLLYQNESIESEVTKILNKFQGIFCLDLDQLEEDLKAQISKIQNVAKIRSLKLSWRTESGELIDFGGEPVSARIDSKNSYLDITSFISTDLI